MTVGRMGIVAIGLALALLVGPSTALAQDHAMAMPKGVSSAGLVTSTGGYKGKAAFPILLTGNTVIIEPGGQTGRQRFLVPAFVYVLEGTLTTDAEGGGTGVGGIQYYTAGQAVAVAPPGTWQNYMNRGQETVKYIELFVGPPGAKTMEQVKASK